MLRNEISIVNSQRIRRAFDAAPYLVGEELRRGIKIATLSVERESRKETPVDTGRLRASHGTEFKNAGLNFTGVVSTNTEYDLFVHEGTRFMKARPYMKKAVQKLEGRIDDILVESIDRALDRVGVMT